MSGSTSRACCSTWRARAFPHRVVTFGQPGGESTVWIAERDGRVVGYLAAKITPGVEVYVNALTTAKEVRRQGIGRALLGPAIRASHRLLAPIRLHVARTNVGAVKLYESEGFRVRSIRRGYYPGGVDAFEMVRGIAPF
jgi:ribosomal protein S18 acetylase RimI-like enzyme